MDRNMFNEDKGNPININLNIDNLEKKIIDAQREDRRYQERKKAEEEHKAREEARKRASDPTYGGIRYWVKNELDVKPVNEINDILLFSHKVKSNKIIAHKNFPNEYGDFYHYIDHCQSEIQVDDYIKFISEQMTIMINSSNLDKESKRNFVSLINNRDQKNEILGLVFILGLIVFCSIAPACSALMLGGYLVEGITLCIASAIVTFGPALLVAAYMDPKPYFSTNSREAREPEAFTIWIKNIYNLTKNYKLPEEENIPTEETIIDAIPVAKVVEAPSQTYRTQTFKLD